MVKTYFFYDLETTGLDPRNDRIMQFAGIRTDLNFNQIGEPYNILIKLNDDTIPSPDALVVTGITPQATQQDGLTEADFARLLMKDIFTEETIVVGYNNIRFDDEFIRALFWRNFIDPYKWAWSDGRSRWDMLDVVRMTRALRPDGVKWPVVDGKEVNKLELLSKENGISHKNAHDALSDVEALIAVTKMIKDKQPQLFNHLFDYRSSNKVKELVNLEEKRPFVYVSGRFDEKFHKATVAFPLTTAKNSNVLVYDLRFEPSEFLELTLKQLSGDDTTKNKLPIKILQYNRCPAVAPISVLEKDDGWEKLGLTKDLIIKHRDLLLSNPSFAENIRSLYEAKPDYPKAEDPEARIYESFTPDSDRPLVQEVSRAGSNQLADLHPQFLDERLEPLLLHYKARNYPSSLSEEETIEWEAWRKQRLSRQLASFVPSMERLAKQYQGDEAKMFVLEELRLWVESIAIVD